MADDEYSAPVPSAERRQAPRFEVGDRLTVRILSSEIRPIRLVNFSTGGLAVTSPEPFMPEEIHRIMVSSDPTWTPVFKAKVIYWRPVATNAPHARYLIGFTFVGMGDAQRESAARLIDDLSKTDTP